MDRRTLPRAALGSAAVFLLVVTVGFDLVHVGDHGRSAVVLGWAYAATFVFAALWADQAWQAHRGRAAKPETAA